MSSANVPHRKCIRFIYWLNKSHAECFGSQVSILRGLKERYEVHHGVRLQDAALVSAAQLSHRYIADRFLPDKAIDLVDEAAAKLNIEVSQSVNSLSSSVHS